MQSGVRPEKMKGSPPKHLRAVLFRTPAFFPSSFLRVRTKKSSIGKRGL